MARSTSIVAAELRVAESRSNLRHSVGRLRYRLSQPSSLAAAVAVGVFLGFALTRRGRASAVVGLLASAVLRHGVDYLVAGAAASRRIPPS